MATKCIICSVRREKSKLKKGSEEWWKLNREFLENKSKCSSIPPLRDNKEWVNDSKGKANLFATTFASKAKLPPETVDCFFCSHPDLVFDDFVAFRSRYTYKLSKSLKVDKATGPDHISAEILRMIAKTIAVPFTMLCRRLLNEGHWPDIWRMHQICPLYKRGSAFQAGHYRGVHLTCILAKTAERIIGQSLVPFLQKRSFGPYQWAFTPGMSARDLVTA